MRENPLQLDEIRRCCLRATPGPWIQRDEVFIETGGDGAPQLIGVLCRTDPENQVSLPARDNAEFIALARTDVPRLVEEVERLRAALQRIADRQQAGSPADYARQVLNKSGTAPPPRDTERGPPNHRPSVALQELSQREIVVDFGCVAG